MFGRVRKKNHAVRYILLVKTSHSFFHTKVDMFLPTHTAFDVESVAAVSTRILSGILDIDSQHSTGNHIVLTSHADVLQITQVYAAGLPNVGEFSSYRFGNGEVRRMGRDVESLPEPVPLQPPTRGQ
jgi:broad specificity phosphatase PhoE